MSNRIAAFGMVGAAQTLPFSWCTDRKPVPVIVFHGTADRLVPYRGGTSWMASTPFPDTVKWTASWARRNHCGESPAESVVAADVKRTEYTGCGGGAAVVLYTVEDGGHTWPGGEPLPRWWLGNTTTSIDASALMWEFFRAHPLREAIASGGP
jgi:polyhydroxybutyrate depolymerase